MPSEVAFFNAVECHISAVRPPTALKTCQRTERFQELVEPLPDEDGLRVLPHVVVDDGLVVVQ